MSNRDEFEALVAHLHDDHHLNAEAMAEDEVVNGTDPEVVERIRHMTRDEALRRLPYHYFMSESVPRASHTALASARITHREEIDATGEACAYTFGVTRTDVEAPEDELEVQA
jgi:hypothetical protein